MILFEPTTTNLMTQKSHCGSVKIQWFMIVSNPLCHSDRGYQYTSKTFHQELIDAGMTQSMSRVAHCTEEGFWGIMKREMYYRKNFHSKDELVLAIIEYLNYYINERPQRKLGILTPMKYHKKMLLVA